MIEPFPMVTQRTGVARRPLQKGEKLRERIEAQLATLQKLPCLVRSFFQALLLPILPTAE
jgi:hypothetical protein